MSLNKKRIINNTRNGGGDDVEYGSTLGYKPYGGGDDVEYGSTLD